MEISDLVPFGSASVRGVGIMGDISPIKTSRNNAQNLNSLSYHILSFTVHAHMMLWRIHRLLLSVGLPQARPNYVHMRKYRNCFNMIYIITNFVC